MGMENPDSESDGKLDALCMGEWSEPQGLSRREFSALSVAAALGAGVAVATPRMAHATEAVLSESDVSVKTADGICDAAFIHPPTGTHPGVLLWADLPSLREAIREIGRQIASAGYAVLIPNFYYRLYKAPLVDRPISPADDELRTKLQAGGRQLTVDALERDTKALIEFLDSQPAVSRSRKMGVAGYCWGGPPTVRTAALFPNRVGAAGIFHGGVVSDKPDSPHLLIPKTKACFLVAVASEDDAKQPLVKDTLRAAFDAARLPATLNVYSGTAHGWTIPDFPVMNGKVIYNPPQAQRAMGHLLELFKQALA